MMETKKKLFFPFLILSFGIILCVSLTSIFYSLTSSKKATDMASTFTSLGFNIYFLSKNKTSTSAEAISIGKDVMQNNDAGYVLCQNEAFYVISSAYKNENDAKLVKNKLEKDGVNSQVVCISFPSIKLSSTFSGSEKEIITNAINSFHDAYAFLYDTAISLDGGILTETSASLNVNSALSNFNTTKNNFDTLFPKPTNNFIQTIKNYLIDGHESLSLLFSKNYITPSQTFSSLIKYRYCELLEINYNLLENLLKVLD